MGCSCSCFRQYSRPVSVKRCSGFVAFLAFLAFFERVPSTVSPATFLLLAYQRGLQVDAAVTREFPARSALSVAPQQKSLASNLATPLTRWTSPASIEHGAAFCDRLRPSVRLRCIRGPRSRAPQLDLHTTSQELRLDGRRIPKATSGTGPRYGVHRSFPAAWFR